MSEADSLKISQRVAEGYEYFKTKLAEPYFFAVSEDGAQFGFSYCGEFSGCQTQNAQQVAINSCEILSGGVPCILFANVDGLLWEGIVEIQTAAEFSPYREAFDEHGAEMPVESNLDTVGPTTARVVADFDRVSKKAGFSYQSAKGGKSAAVCLIWDSKRGPSPYMKYAFWRYGLKSNESASHAVKQSCLDWKSKNSETSCSCQHLYVGDATVLRIPAGARAQVGKTTNMQRTAKTEVEQTNIRSVAFSWEGVSDLIPGSVTKARDGVGGAITFRLPNGRDHCSGSYSHVGPRKGIWSLACSDGHTATGTFTAYGEVRSVTGEGTDNKSRSVRYTVSPSTAVEKPVTYPVVYSRSKLWSVEVTKEYGCFLGQKNSRGQVFGIGAARSQSESDVALFAFIESDSWRFTKANSEIVLWLGTETLFLEGKVPPGVDGALVGKLESSTFEKLVNLTDKGDIVLRRPQTAKWSLDGFRFALNDWTNCNDQYIRGGGPDAVKPKAS